MSELVRLRRARGFSQRELAERAKVSPATVYEVEVGRRPQPRGSTLRKLADALGVDVSELVEEFGTSKKGPRLLSAEWALKVSDEVFSREIKAADTDRLHKLLSELVGDEYTRSLEDVKAEHKSEEKHQQTTRRVEAFSRAYGVWSELRERGEESPEKGLPALRKYLEALGYV